MKGKISLNDFIHRVKGELVAAQQPDGNPFYELTEVTLEVSFALDASAKAGFDLYVVELGSEAKAQQTHKVALKLKPLPVRTPATLGGRGASPDPAQATTVDAAVASTSPTAKEEGHKTGAGGGGLLHSDRGPVYDKIRDIW